LRYYKKFFALVLIGVLVFVSTFQYHTEQAQAFVPLIVEGGVLAGDAVASAVELTLISGGLGTADAAALDAAEVSFWAGMSLAQKGMFIAAVGQVGVGAVQISSMMWNTVKAFLGNNYTPGAQVKSVVTPLIGTVSLSMSGTNWGTSVIINGVTYVLTSSGPAGFVAVYVNDNLIGNLFLDHVIGFTVTAAGLLGFIYVASPGDIDTHIYNVANSNIYSGGINIVNSPVQANYYVPFNYNNTSDVTKAEQTWVNPNSGKQEVYINTGASAVGTPDSSASNVAKTEANVIGDTRVIPITPVVNPVTPVTPADTDIGIMGQILEFLQNALNAILAPIQAIWAGINLLINPINAVVQSLDKFFDPTVPINFEPLKMAGVAFTRTFPFSLPWDLLNGFNSISGASWDGIIPVSFSVPNGGSAVFDIDLSMFAPLLWPCKTALLLCFDLGLILITRKILGGAV
jgi:hypothetical protein